MYIDSLVLKTVLMKKKTRFPRASHDWLTNHSIKRNGRSHYRCSLIHYMLPILTMKFWILLHLRLLLPCWGVWTLDKRYTAGEVLDPNHNVKLDCLFYVFESLKCHIVLINQLLITASKQQLPAGRNFPLP